MKRFVDLRQSEIGCNFAWWDTVRNVFESFNGDFGFEDWEDFTYSFNSDNRYKDVDLARYRSLCPDWAFDTRKDGKTGA